MYERFEKLLQDAISPLDTYLSMYDQYKDIMVINIEEYCKLMDNDDEPKEISEI